MDIRTFTLRGVTDEDAPAIVALQRERTASMGVEPSETLGELRNDWASPGFDRARAVRVVESGDGVVGYVAAFLHGASESGQAGFQGYVTPSHRCRGIGAALVDFAVDTIRSEPGVGTAVTGVDAEDTQARALVESVGFRHVRSFYRVHHPDPASAEAPCPEGIRITNELRGDDLFDALCVAHDRSFIDHWNFHPARREGFVDSMRYDGVSPETIFVALAPDGDVAGYCWSYTEQTESGSRGWVGQLGTSRGYRKRGLGAALLCRGLRELAARGAGRVGLTVDADNLTGALRLYLRTGFEVVNETATYWLEL